MKTIPSILDPNAPILKKHLEKLSPYFSRFQIDIADGQLVPNKTLSVDDVVKFFSNNQYPMTNNQYFDFHLMVKDYEGEIKKLEKLKKLINIKNIFIHYCALTTTYPLQPTHYSLPIGLVLNPSDKVSDLVSHFDLNKIPFIQIMSVSPGFQGQAFIPQTLNKIEQLRALGYRSPIFLDGAINEKTIPIILSKKYLPDFICPGSYLVAAQNIKERVNELNHLLK